MAATNNDQLLNALAFSRHAKIESSKVVKANKIASRRGAAGIIGPNMTLLDCIALMLVDQRNADVAAVSFLRTNGTVEVLYSMNKNVVDTRGVVVDEIVNIANAIIDSESPDMESFRFQLSAIAPRYCRRKLERRRSKLVEAWQAVMATGRARLAVPTTERLNVFLRNNPSADVQLTPTTWADWLMHWFTNVASRPFFAVVGTVPLPSLREINSVLITSRLLGQMDVLSDTIPILDEADRLMGRLRKLGQYMEFVAKASTTVKRERKLTKGSVHFKARKVRRSRSRASSLIMHIDTN